MCGRGCASHALAVLSPASRSVLTCLQALLCALLSAAEASSVLFLVLSLLAGTLHWVLKTPQSLSTLSLVFQLKLFASLCLPSHSSHRSLDSLSRPWGRAPSVLFAVSRGSHYPLLPYALTVLKTVVPCFGGFCFSVVSDERVNLLHYLIWLEAEVSITFLFYYVPFKTLLWSNLPLSQQKREQAACSSSCDCSDPQSEPWGGCQIIPISWTREPSLREVERLVQSHPVYKRLSHIPPRCCPCSSQEVLLWFLKYFGGRGEKKRWDPGHRANELGAGEGQGFCEWFSCCTSPWPTSEKGTVSPR